MSTETTRMRTEAESLIAKASEAISEGELDKSNSFIDEAEKIHAKAESLDDAAGRIKILQADQRDLDANRTEVAPQDRELAIVAKEATRNGANYSTDYKPENYIKSMPAASQSKAVLDLCGENVKAEAQSYVDTFRAWCSKATNEQFMREATPSQIKQMTEGTDADGGYYVPEQFIARNVELYQGIPGGTLRDRTTNIRVSSKDGYAPAMAAVAWAAQTEGSAPTAVVPVISQISFSLEKSGSLVQVSDELLADEAMSVPDMLAGACRKAAGQYQNSRLLNGSGAWEGVMTGAVGISQYSFANAASITAADLTNLYYQIDADFRDSDDSIFVSRSTVAAAVAAIGGTAAGIHALDSLTQGPSDFLLGKPYLQDDTNPTGASPSGNGLSAAITTGQPTFVFGDWSWIYLFERQGFTVSRNDSVYWDSGQHNNNGRIKISAVIINKAPHISDFVGALGELLEALNRRVMVISSQANQERDWKVQRLGGSNRYSSNTPLAPSYFNINIEVDDIVRTASKDAEDHRNDDPFTLLLCKVTILLVGFKFTYRMGSATSNTSAFVIGVQA